MSYATGLYKSYKSIEYLSPKYKQFKHITQCVSSNRTLKVLTNVTSVIPLIIHASIKDKIRLQISSKNGNLPLTPETKLL